jgi:histidinol-phosphate aminotransferase
MDTRDLSAHAPYAPGRGIDEVARELGRDPTSLIKLSANENPLGPPPAAVQALADPREGMSSYPKSAVVDLRGAVADHVGVDPAQVWLAAGADGAIDYLHRAMLRPGERILVPEPGFAYYAMSARYHHGEVDTYRLEAAEEFIQQPAKVIDAYDDHRLVFLTTPNNPTGTELRPAQIREIAAAVGPETLVVIDEAYGEFSEHPSMTEAVDAVGNIAVLRTFSKAYGLAGLRIGYAVVPESLTDAYPRVNTPFATNHLACRAALAALGDTAHLDATIRTVREARALLEDEFSAHTWASGGNFVLAEVGAATAVTEAAQEAGVIVRDTTSFGLPRCIRISCGTVGETERAIETLESIIAG